MSARPTQAIRFKGRSYFSLTISPELPLADWLTRLDGWLERSPGFFSRNAVILDVRDLGMTRADFIDLLKGLKDRGVRVLGAEGADPSWAGPDTPPFMPSGKDMRTSESEVGPSGKGPSGKGPGGNGPGGAGSSEAPGRSAPEAAAHATPAAPIAASGWAAPLYIDSPVRSGQSVLHPEGDVVITGSVASGAEVVAAGSIHIYGALRGRAMAGAYGDETARIFCRSLEAELIAVNGLYQTADEIDPQFRKQPAQIRLKHGIMLVSKFD